MRLTPRELERLQLFSAAELGRKPKVRGVKLNYPKAVALL
jgi:urease gamma subunit